MGKKEEYKFKNEQYLESLRTEEEVKELAAGVLYRTLETGQGSTSPRCGFSTLQRNAYQWS